MTQFDFLVRVALPVLMLIAPLAFVLAMRLFLSPMVAPAQVRRARILTWSLWCGTLVALVIFGVAHQYLRWNLAVQVMFLFFPLWFALAMPLLSLQYPKVFQTHLHDRPIRTAALVPRELENPIPRVAWLLPWVLWATGLALLFWARQAAQAENLLQWRIHLAVQFALVFLPALGPSMVRRLLQEPEPLSEPVTSDVLEDYRSVRFFRAIGMYTLICLMLFAFSALHVASACGMSGPVAGRWGTVAGIVLGVAGTVVGVTAGLWRSRIHGRVWSEPNRSQERR
jgi:hypothetical protein